MACGIPKLYHDNTLIGDCVHGLQTSVRRLTQIHRRGRFWSTDVTIDGAYPDPIWQHTITIFEESTDEDAFAEFVFNLSDLFYSTPKSLTVKRDGVVVINYGNCLLERPDLDTPDSLLLTAGGLITLDFLGTTKPIVT